MPPSWYTYSFLGLKGEKRKPCLSACTPKAQGEFKLNIAPPLVDFQRVIAPTYSTSASFGSLFIARLYAPCPFIVLPSLAYPSMFGVSTIKVNEAPLLVDLYTPPKGLEPPFHTTQNSLEVSLGQVAILMPAQVILLLTSDAIQLLPLLCER